jgi:presenilin-like A22 family membrane protease
VTNVAQLHLNLYLPVEGQEHQLPWLAVGAIVGFAVGVLVVLEWRLR